MLSATLTRGLRIFSLQRLKRKPPSLIKKGYFEFYLSAQDMAKEYIWFVTFSRNTIIEKKARLWYNIVIQSELKKLSFVQFPQTIPLQMSGTNLISNLKNVQIFSARFFTPFFIPLGGLT